MMKSNYKEIERFNDGLLSYGSIAPVYNARREKTGEKFVEKGRLFYSVKSAREGDLMTAANLDYKIDLKVKTFNRPNIRTTDKVKISGSLYEIKQLDPSGEHMYLFLQRVNAGGGGLAED